jgi:biotin carboxyl carrier protein
LIVDVDLAGRRHAVDVRREGDRWSVTVGGRTVTASVTEIGGRWSLLIATPSASARSELRRDGPGSIARGPEVARSLEVSIEPRAGGELIVHVNGRAVGVTIDTRRKRRRESAAAAAGPTAVVAPMPGRIVKLLVAPGDVVEALQPLVVVEAMKMENELRAPRAGSVADVRISQGMSVEANAVLMVIV